MSIELNQTTFRRLVQLSLLLLVVCIVVAAYEVMHPKWSAFGEDFDALVAQHFGGVEELSEPTLIALLIVMLGLLVWMVVSLLGALRFKRWARVGLWMPLPIVILLGVVVPGWYPAYTTPFWDLFALLDTAVLGTIILLAYSREHGDRWFAPKSTTETEI